MSEADYQIRLVESGVNFGHFAVVLRGGVNVHETDTYGNPGAAKSAAVSWLAKSGIRLEGDDG